MIEFKIYQKNKTIDLSNYVVGDATVQTRVDYAYAEGSLNLMIPIITSDLTSFDKNIPPYTLCKVNGVPYVCSSKRKPYPMQDTTNYYFHEVKLLELTAIFETFVLGVKTWTNITELTSFSETIELIEYKYPGYSFTINQSVSFSGNHDYTFKVGTTLADVLREYGKRNVIKLYADSFVYNQQTSKWEINISSMPLISNTFISHSYISKATAVSTEQNSDNYCKYLETVQDNVVDRDNECRFNDLTCRNTTSAMNADSADLLLPTNVESITEFIVNGNYGYKFNFDNMTDIFTADFFIQHGQVYTDGFYIQCNFGDLINYNISYGGHSNIFQWIIDQWNQFFTSIDMTNTFRINYNVSTHKLTTIMSMNMASKSNYYIDYIDYLLEETEWNALPLREKPKYAVYKTGTNRIYNLNGSYQKNFINDVMHLSVGNYLEENTVESNFNIDDDNYIILIASATNDVHPTYHSYTIKAVPLLNNFMLVDTKDNNPTNETAWKPMTRTYQNSANPVEFNALVSEMKEQNRVLGTEEISLECVIPIIYPTANYRFTYNQVDYYVDSMIYTIKPNYTTVTINGTIEPQKIADVIGVEYQYSPTQLPTENILVRPLFFEVFETNLYDEVHYNYNNNFDIYLALNFGTGATSHKVLIRVAITKDLDNIYYLYGCMQDNYSAGKKSINISGENYEVVDVPYVDTNYKVQSIHDIAVVCMRQSLGIQFSEKMPDIDYETEIDGVLSSYIEDIGMYEIYKDDRETLAFTIKVMPE